MSARRRSMTCAARAEAPTGSGSALSSAFVSRTASGGLAAMRAAIEREMVSRGRSGRFAEHRTFHRSASYTEGRSMKRSRDERALKRKSTFGRMVAAGEWATSEWSALNRCWELGLPVPYPVQIEGTEILMEWITVPVDGGDETAPRLAQTRPAPDLLASYFDQLRAAMLTLVQAGLVHGDLSEFNILLAADGPVIAYVTTVARPAPRLSEAARCTTSAFGSSARTTEAVASWGGGNSDSV